ncbi:N19M [Sanghuangporus weigelae]
MALASLRTPFKATYRYFQRQAHENPVIFWSCVLGLTSPIFAFTVPPIRKHFFGYVPPPPIPTSYPLPQRARRPIQGYEDEE